MFHYLIVFLGSGLGGITRFGLIRFVTIVMRYDSFYAIFLCNILGCFLAGLAFAFALSRPQWGIFPLLTITGFAGGFTTFSAFSLDIIKLYQNNHYHAFLYIITSLILSIILCTLGLWIGKILFSYF